MTSNLDLTGEQLRQVVAGATLAPSIHNTQPWRWRTAGGGLDLYADPARHLGVADPDGRQLLVSCGAALLNARVSLRRLGLLADVILLPDDPDELDLSGDGPLLATIRPVGTEPAGADELALAGALTRRHTDRRPFEPRPLDPDVIAALRRAAETEGAWLVALHDPDVMVDTAVVLARADWLESHDPAYRAELAKWSRTDPAARDGIPRAAVVESDDQRPTDFVPRDFDVVGEPGIRLEQTEVERPTVIILGTDTDRPVDQLAAGQALGRVLLTATVHGAAASPLGQAIDLDSSRELLRAAVGGLGNVQMLIRVGYPDQDAPPLAATPRRAVADVLVES